MGAVLSKLIVFASMVKVKADFEKYQHTKKSMQRLKYFYFHICFGKSMGAVLSKFIVFASLVKVKVDFEKYKQTKKTCKISYLTL